jgi:hypothetical protein
MSTIGNPNVNKHVRFLTQPDQEKWLKQRGWVRVGDVVWEEPSSGLRFGFAAAFQRAQDQCRLPADSELKPEG